MVKICPHCGNTELEHKKGESYCPKCKYTGICPDVDEKEIPMFKQGYSTIHQQPKIDYARGLKEKDYLDTHMRFFFEYIIVSFLICVIVLFLTRSILLFVVLFCILTAILVTINLVKTQR
jgi:hypothetical protein